MIALVAIGGWGGEALRATLFAVGFAAVVAGTEFWYRRYRPPVEWTRKTLHVAFGLAAATLPWVLRSHWTLLVLLASLAIPLAWARRRRLVPSLFDVERQSYGEIYFPAGIYLLFVVSTGHRVFYLVSLITLVICDALAAVLGKSYGRHRYAVHHDQRSLEGSAVFLFTAFLGTHLPLLLLTHIDRGTCVMISLQLALIVTAFEAITTGGSDNLVLPLTTYYLLVKLTPRPSAAIGVQLAVQLGLLAAMLLFARRTRYLSFSGAVAAHLVLYGAFSLGGPRWLMAPALALVALVALDRNDHRRLAATTGGYDVQTIFYVVIVAVMWLFADNSFATLVPASGPLRTGHPFHVLFVGALAASVAVIAYWNFENVPRLRKRSPAYRGLVAATLGYGAVALLGLWALRGARLGVELGVAALVCVLGLLSHLVLRRILQPAAGSVWALRLLALGVLLASLVVLPFHLWTLGIEPWRTMP
jgi:phytol kinase